MRVTPAHIEHSPESKWAAKVPRALACAVALLGFVVLLGWTLNIEVLKSLRHDYVAMNPATAVCMIFTAAGLWLTSSLERKRWHSIAITALAGCVALLGMLRLIGYMLGWQHGADTLLFAHDVDTADHQNRMAPNTALLMILTGASLLLLELRSLWARRTADLLGAAILFLSMLAAVGYAFEVAPMYSVAAFIPMALHTALGFVAIGFAVLFVAPSEGIVSIVTSPHVGGSVARRFLPAAVGVVLVLSWLRLEGERSGLYETEFGVTMMAMMTIVIMTAFTIWNSSLLNRSDAQRKHSEHQLQLAYDGLENLVQQRTAELETANIELQAEVEQRAAAQHMLAKQAAHLKQSNRELEQFAYVASHDLQEPLRMVGSYLQLLERRFSDRLDGDAREFIGFAVDGANRMKQLINDLLQYSRVDRRHQPLSPTDGNVALNEVLHNLKASIDESGAVITADPLPTVTADPTQLRQLLQNILGNAVKFHGDEPPRIRVSATEENGHWVFSIKDNGIGIDPQFADRIFDVFQRLHSREKYPGTGIGLAICKKIIERHGGRIWVESSPGAGATFKFTIPVQAEVTHEYKRVA